MTEPPFFSAQWPREWFTHWLTSCSLFKFSSGTIHLSVATVSLFYGPLLHFLLLSRRDGFGVASLWIHLKTCLKSPCKKDYDCRYSGYCRKSLLAEGTKVTVSDCLTVFVHPQTIIHNNEVEIVCKYKYRGTIFDDKLKWDDNAEEIVKKGQQRLYLLRKLNYFSVDQKILTLLFFNKSFIESVLSFSFICWFHSLGVKNRNSLQRIVRIASKITAVPQRDLALFCEQQILRKARSILTKKEHILNQEFTTLPSGRRLRCPICKTNRFKNSFMPVAVHLLNNT